MKILRYLTVLSAAAVAFTSCKTEPADLVGRVPIAPIINEITDVVITDIMLDESVTLSWSEARNVAGEVTYDLYLNYELGGVADYPLASGIVNSYYSIKKEALRDMLMAAPFNVSENESASLSVYVAVNIDGEPAESLTSSSAALTVRLYPEDVAPEVSVETASVVLTEEQADDYIELLSWTEASAGANEKISAYSVSGSVNGNEWYDLSGKLPVAGFANGLNYGIKAKDLNEFLNFTLNLTEEQLANGADVYFRVLAYSESYYNNGNPSEAVTVNCKGWPLAKFPESVMVVGDFCDVGWSTGGIAPTLNSVGEGVYYGVIAFYNAEWGFKIVYDGKWIGQVEENDGVFKLGDGGNIFEYPDGKNDGSYEGCYAIYANLNENELRTLLIESVCIVGSACDNDWSYNDSRALTFDSETHLWKIEGLTLNDGEIKVMFNKDWTWDWNNGQYAFNLGGTTDNLVYNGPNIPVSAGTYDITLDFTNNKNNTLQMEKR